MKVVTALVCVLLGSTAACIWLTVALRGRQDLALADTVAPSLRASVISARAAGHRESQVTRPEAAGGARTGQLQQAPQGADSSGQAFEPLQQTTSSYSRPSGAADQGSAESTSDNADTAQTYTGTSPDFAADSNNSSNHTAPAALLAAGGPIITAGNRTPPKATSSTCTEPETSWEYNRELISYAILRNVIAHCSAFGLNLGSPEAITRELWLLALR